MFSGRRDPSAILEMGKEEVLVAKIVSSAEDASTSLTMFLFRSRSSKTASITRSTLERPWLPVNGCRRPDFSSFSNSLITLFSTFLLNPSRSEEHTSELQSRGHLVCRLLLEKKKK